ncbi:NAD-dependent epimerase/dehydratase family protein [Candidatus Poribacteria bacterium]|nr:NAD-dependent epimerase/dehydratase family protein [Candidatus Poribacteria bacterium]
MKVLVTGGAGFIGSHVVDRIVEEGHEVVVVDDLSAGVESRLNPNAKFYNMDIRSPELAEVFEAEKPQVVDHHAAQTKVIRSVREPMYDCWVNMEGSINLIHLSYRYGVEKFIYSSTGGAMYGEPEYLPVDEVHPINPLSPYGASKHSVEHYIFMYGVNYGLKYAILRYPNIYGPRQDPYGEAGVVAIFTQKMLKGKRPNIFGDGTATRDYVYVGDVVNANILALENADKLICNLGSCRETSVNRIFQLIKSETGFKLEPIYTPKRVGEVQRIYLTNERAKAELGWHPAVSIQEGIKKTVEYYRGNL